MSPGWDTTPNKLMRRRRKEVLGGIYDVDHWRRR